MLVAFERELAHLALDHPRPGTQPAWGSRCAAAQPWIPLLSRSTSPGITNECRGEHALWIEGVPRLYPTVVSRAEVRSPPVVVDFTHPVGQVSLAPSPCQQLGKPSMDIKRFGEKFRRYLRVHHAEEGKVA